jgi:hypothetical protein
MTRKRRYLKQSFQARKYPSAIALPPADFDTGLDGEIIAGPFCVHCGNPFSLHSATLRCPDRHLHPAFPPPRLPFKEGA